MGYAAQEVVIKIGQRMEGMYVVKSGIAVGGPTMKDGKGFGTVYTIEKCFGVEGVLLKRRYQYEVRSLNYVHVERLNKCNLDDILHAGEFPNIYKAIRKTVLKLVFKQNVL